MRTGRNPLTPDEQERLERLLEWRRATGRGPRAPRGRWIPYVAGALVLGVLVALAAMLVIASLTSWPDQAQQRVATAPPPRSVAPAPVERPGSEPTTIEPPRTVAPAPAARPGPEPTVAEPPPARAKTERAPVRALPERAAERSPRPAPDDRTAGSASISSAPTDRPASREEPAAPPIVRVEPPTPAPPSSRREVTSRPLPPVVRVEPPAPASPPASTPPAPGSPPTPASPPPRPEAAAPPVPPVVRVEPPAPASPPASTSNSRPAETPPEVAPRPLPQPLETLKRWVQYAPEVRVGKAIIRWVKSQPPPDPAPSQPEPRSPQSR